MEVKTKNIIFWSIVAALTATILILIIIWYRNSQKDQEVNAAKANAAKINPPKTTSTPSSFTALYASSNTSPLNPVILLNTLDFSEAYEKLNPNDFVGVIIANTSDDGNNKYYKVVNSAGQILYVAKIGVVTG